jgi:hypothetical protein
MTATFNNPFAEPLRELRELHAVERVATPGAKLERLCEIRDDLELMCSIYPLDTGRRTLLYRVRALIEQYEDGDDFPDK